MFQHNNSKSHELVWVTMSEWQFWRDNKKFMKGILVRWVWRTFFMQETYHMTICWQFSRHLWSRFLFSNVKEDSGVIRCLKPVIPRKEQNKLCYSLRLNELCKCMWQVNIGGLWRRYPHPPHSAEPRRPQPNEDWTLIIRRIWLPHETHTHTHRACLITLPPCSLSEPHTHTNACSLTSQGFRCRPVLCRLYTQSLCRRLWVFSALQTGVVGVPVAVVPMETRLIRTESCMGTWLVVRM